MRRISLIGLVSIVAFVTLFVGWEWAQQPVWSAGPPDADTVPPLYLRTRIALPGVYGRMDHYGLDTKRDTLIVSTLGNNAVELISNWKRVPIQSLVSNIHKARSTFQVLTGSWCRTNRAKSASMMPKLTSFLRRWISEKTRIQTICATMLHRSESM